MKTNSKLINIKSNNASLFEEINLQKKIIESTEAIILVLNLDSSVHSISKGAERIIGYTNKELINKKWFDIIVPPKKYPQYVIGYTSFLSSKNKIRTIVAPVVCKDKTVKTISWKTNKVFSNKKLIGTVAIGKDVTDIEQQINLLKESEEKFRNLAELLPTPISCKTTDDKIIFLNKAYTQQFGYTLNDIPNFTEWLKVAYKTDADRKKALSDWRKSVATLQSGKKTKTAIITVYNKKNEKRILKHDTTISNNNIYCSYYDITDEVLEEQKLKESEEKFRTLAELVPLPISFITTDGKIVFLNKAYTQQFGYTLKEIPTIKKLFDISYKTNKEKKIAEKYWEEDVKKLAKNVQLQPRRLTVYSKLGQKRIMEYSATRYENFIYYAYLDITAQIEKEESLLQSKEAFERIAENTPIPVGGCNIETLDLKFSNKKFEEIFGYKYTDDVLFTTWYERIIYQSVKDKEIKENEFNEYAIALIQNKIPQKKILERQILCVDKMIRTFEIGLTYDNDTMYAFFYDITLRKENEKNLRESETRFRTLAEQMVLPVAFVTVDGKFVFLNKAFTKNFGYSLTDFPDIKTVVENTKADKKTKLKGIESWENEVKKLFETKKPIKNRIEIEAKNGEIKLVEYTATLADKYAYYIYTDITKQKLKEDDLIKSRNAFRGIAENTPVAIAGADVATLKVAFANKQFVDALGYTQTDINKMKEWGDLLVYDDDIEKEQSLAAWQNVKMELLRNDNKAIKVLERKIRCKNGEVKTFEVAITYDSNTIYGLFYDITERKIAEKSLKESRETFKRIAENTPIAVGGCNLKTLNVTFLNKKFVETFGYEQKEIEHLEDWFAIILATSKEDSAKNNNEWQMMLSNFSNGIQTEIKRIERHIICKNGTIKICEIGFTVSDGTIYGFFNDVTEQKEADKLLKESEERFRNIAENLPVPVTSFHLEQGLIFANKKQKELLGYTSESFGNPADFIKNIIPTKQAPNAQDTYLDLLALLKTNKSIEPISLPPHEMKVMCADGVARTFEISETIYGQTLYSIFHDITEQRKAEQKLGESEQRFRSIVENLPLPLVSVNIDSNIIYTNKKHTELIGHNNSNKNTSAKIISDFSIDDIVDNDDKKRFQKTIKLLKNNDANKHIAIPNYVTKILCKDNQIRTFEISENIFGDTLYTLFNDITEQTLAREVLMESEQKFRALAENMPTAIGGYDETGKTIFVNKSFTQITGYTLADVPTVKQWYKLTQPNISKRFEFYTYWETLVTNYKNAKTKEPVTIFSTALCKDGSFKHFSFSFSVYNNITYLMLIDITEQEKAKKQLEKSHQELRTLTTYLQNVREEERKNISREIHDELGQQLTGIKMAVSSIFKKNVVNDKEDELRRKEVIEMLNTTVKTVRTISTQLRPSILDDLGVTATFEWLIQDFKKRTGIICHCYFDVDEEVVTVEMKNNLFRILQESLTNIMRHSAATTVYVDFFIIANQLRLIIADNGKGFNKNLPKATLGIIGMRERTSVLGGTFAIVSEKTKGTRIIISIPVKTQNENTNR